MPRVSLSPRLAHIAKMIPRDARVADIGTDHARLPLWLWQNGAARSFIATELSDGPMERARKMIMRCGAEGKIDLRPGDGLSPIKEGEADIVVIAGMGGETIAGILESARREGRGFDGETLILQPMSGFYELRKYLYNTGFEVTGESLCLERGRVRLFMKAGAGKPEKYDIARLFFGRLDREDDLFERYRETQARHLKKVINGLELRGGADELEEYKAALSDCEKMRKK